MRRALSLIIIFLLPLYYSCGGSGGNNGSAQHSPNASDIASANASNLSAALDLTARMLSISWKDQFSDEKAYEIQFRNFDSNSDAWTAVETLCQLDGTGIQTSWKRVIDAPGEYRVIAVKDSYSVPLCTSAGNSDLSVLLLLNSPLIIFDSTEPLIGRVNVSISEVTDILSVDYYADFVFIEASTTGPDFPIEWNTATLPNGAHLISAMAQTSPGVYVELRRQVTTDNPNVAVQQELSGTSGIVNLDVRASAEVGIQSVETFMDDSSQGVLTTPNNGTIFQWTIDTNSVAAGPHTLLSRATDRHGKTAESTLTPIFAHPPVIAIDSPLDGAIVSKQLLIRGSFSGDTAGTSVSIYFGDVPLLTTSISPFTKTYDLSGVTYGDYTLTAIATDAFQNTTVLQHSVTVQSNTQFSYVFVDSGKQIFAADEGQLLYQTSDNAIHLRSLSTSDIILSDTESIQNASGWQLSNGRIAVFGQLGGYPNPYQVFLYEPGGNRRNLSEESQSIGFYDLYPVLQWPWIVWSSQWANSVGGYGGTHALDSYILFNMQTDEYQSIEMPVDASLLGNWNYALALLPSDTRFYYWAITGGSDGDSSRDIYYFSTASQSSARVTNGDAIQVYIQSDGDRVAWQKAAQVEQAQFDIMVASVENPQSAHSITSFGHSFILRDGILAWQESDGVTSTLIADDGSQITLSLLNSARLWNVGGGHVIFSADGKLYIWDRARSIRKLLDSLPENVLIDGDRMYFINQGNAIYFVNIQ